MRGDWELNAQVHTLQCGHFACIVCTHTLRGMDVNLMNGLVATHETTETEPNSLNMQDLSKKKRPLSKSAYAVRVRSRCGLQKAQRVASNFAKGLKRVCNEVIAKKGAASSG